MEGKGYFLVIEKIYKVKKEVKTRKGITSEKRKR